MSVPWNRLTREEAEVYLENQRELGYNLIQVMVIHSETTLNVYGNRPFADEDVTKPVLMGDTLGHCQMKYDQRTEDHLHKQFHQVLEYHLDAYGK